MATSIERSLGRHRGEGGVSLIELLIFIVIVSGGLTGMLATMNTIVMRSADPMLQKQLLSISESLLDEISNKAFAPVEGGFTPSNQTCASFRTERARYDDIGDYQGISDCPIYSLADNAIVPGLENYRMSITVTASSALNGLPSTRARLISVRVAIGNEVLQLQGWRTSHGD